MNNIGSFLHNALTSLGNYFTPHMQSPVPNRDSFPDQSGLQDYYAHQQNNDPHSFMPQANAQAKPQPTAVPSQPVQQKPGWSVHLGSWNTPAQSPSSQYNNQPTTGIHGFTTTPVPSDYEKLITSAGKEVGINPAVLASLLFTEHGFSRDPGINRNTNGSYDRGPAQINNLAHPDVTDAQAENPSFAIPWAAHLLSRYASEAGGLRQGIEAYNAGVGGQKSGGGRDYLGKVKRGLSPDLIQQLGL